MMKHSLCEKCRNAIWEGGDYAPGFGGCCLPEYVVECKDGQVQESEGYEDMDFDNVYSCKHYQNN